MDAGKFLQRSNQLVREIAAARDWSEARERLLTYTALTQELGECIGVPARIDVPVDTPQDGGGHRIVKAAGAGNELGIVISDPDLLGDTIGEPISIDPDGIAWA